MNKLEISLIVIRLKNALIMSKLEYRKPVHARNIHKLIKAKNTIRTLNRWIYSEKSNVK